MKQLLTQIIKFGIVGGVCFFIDWGLLALATECLGIHYLISGIISFSVSVITNYLLSRRFVFRMEEKRETKKEFILFLILSVIGLGINEAVMFAMVEKMQIHYLLSKVAATAIVMVYNFITRKLLMESRDMPAVSRERKLLHGREESNG